VGEALWLRPLFPVEPAGIRISVMCLRTGLVVCIDADCMRPRVFGPGRPPLSVLSGW